MRIIRLQAQNFKRLTAVDISPEGDIVRITGKNAQGKSSILDAISEAIEGVDSAETPKPVRTGEQEAIIRLDTGEYKITRTFSAEGGSTLKVETADGFKASSPQAVLNSVFSSIGFDPLEFTRMKADEQAAELRRLVPLSIDLDDLAKLDAADYAARRDINRDGKALEAQLDAIPDPGELPEVKPDRDALVAKLAEAGETNTAIERDRMERERRQDTINNRGQQSIDLLARAAALRKEADEAEAEAAMISKGTAERQAEFDALPPLAEPVDADVVREQMRAAEAALIKFAHAERRKALEFEIATKTAESEKLTQQMKDREAERKKALAEAEMPVAGLGFAIGPDGKAFVTMNGEPFKQASQAEKLRVSTALAMAANPKLRVALIRDGSLIDEDGLALLAELAAEGDFQIWLEAVGTGGVGFIMEDGAVKDAPTPEPIETGRKKKAAGDEPTTDKAESSSEAPDSSSEAPDSSSKPPAKRKPVATGGLFGED